MSVYKSILRNSSGYSVSIVVGRIVSVLMLPITTHFLGPADFGVLELLDLTLYVFGTLVGIQLGESLLFYYFATNSTETRNHVASTAILGSFMLGTVIATGGWFMAPGLSQAVFRDPQYTGLLRLACCNLGLTCPMETGLSWLRAHNLPFRYNVVALLRIGIAAVLNFVFLAFYGLGVASLQWSALVTTGILSVALCSWVMWQTGCFLSLSGLWKQLRFGAPISIGGLFMLVLHYGDRFFLQRSVSLADIGIYGVAYKLGMMTSIIMTPFTLYWRSQMFTVVREPGGERVYARVFSYLCLILCLSAVVMSVFVHPALRIMASREFQGAAVYVPWIATAYIFRGLGDHARAVFNLEKKTSRHIAANLGGALPCLVLYAVFIPRYGVWGAVGATCGGFGCYLLASLWNAQRVRHFNLEFGRWAKVLVSSLACMAAGVWIHVQGIIPQILTGMALLAVWVGLLFATRFFTASEREVIWETIAGMRKRLEPAARSIV